MAAQRVYAAAQRVFVDAADVAMLADIHPPCAVAFDALFDVYVCRC